MRHHSDTTSSTRHASAGAGGHACLISASARLNSAERIEWYAAASWAPPVSAAWLDAAGSRNNSAGPSSLHARAALLLFSMTFERERNEPVEQRGERKAARCPHLRVHPNRREPG